MIVKVDAHIHTCRCRDQSREFLRIERHEFSDKIYFRNQTKNINKCIPRSVIVKAVKL